MQIHNQDGAEWTEIKHSSGTQSILPAPKDTEKQKRWQAANSLCRRWHEPQRVNKVEALTIKQNVVDQRGWRAADLQRNPLEIDFPNVVFTIQKSTPSPLQVV